MPRNRRCDTAERTFNSLGTIFRTRAQRYTQCTGQPQASRRISQLRANERPRSGDRRVISREDPPGVQEVPPPVEGQNSTYFLLDTTVQGVYTDVEPISPISNTCEPIG